MRIVRADLMHSISMASERLVFLSDFTTDPMRRSALARQHARYVRDWSTNSLNALSSAAGTATAVGTRTQVPGTQDGTTSHPVVGSNRAGDKDEDRKPDDTSLVGDDRSVQKRTIWLLPVRR